MFIAQVSSYKKSDLGKCKFLKDVMCVIDPSYLNKNSTQKTNNHTEFSEKCALITIYLDE